VHVKGDALTLNLQQVRANQSTAALWNGRVRPPKDGSALQFG
jgi:hypothetical protein